MEKVNYGGWTNCIRMSNGTIELIATTDVGPRIIRFGFVGQDNEFYEAADQIGKTGGEAWRAYGGHRLWHAPEANPRTYALDNSPVNYQMAGDTLRLIQDTEATTGVQKEIELTMDSNRVHVVHKLTNRNLWAVEFAPWSISQMAPGGEAILPQDPYSPHPAIPDFPGQVIDDKYYLPVRSIALWSYAKLDDPRWVFTSKYIILKHDPSRDRPQKIGISNEENWGAYARNGHLFMKKMVYQEGAVYPDRGSSFEVFTNAAMLELETLGPMVKLEPGATVTHIEDWYLFDRVSFENTDESIDANVMPKAREGTSDE